VKRVWLRAAVLAVAVVGVLVGLTVYYSSEKVPRCLVSGTGTWHPPTDGKTHRYEVVVLGRNACFFDMDHAQKLVGALRLSQAKWLSAAVPADSETLTVDDEQHHVIYVTERGLLGVRVFALGTNSELYVAHFRGFTWNPRFGPNPPSHGLSVAPDRPELWVLDAPNSTVHLFDVSGLPTQPPRKIDDIRLSRPISGDENPCSGSCARLGSLQHSADGRFVYVGDSGDVIDAEKRETVGNLEALHNSRIHFEVDWVRGKPVFPRRR
jgi:hypothetical protein